MIKDLIVIGAGPGGVDAAEYASKNGLNVTIIEKSNLGGVCLNEGCIPTKTLLNTAHILEKIQNADKYALSVNDNVSVDMDKLMKRKTKILRKLSAGIKQTLTKSNVEIINAEAKILGKNNEGNILIQANDQTLETKNLIIATGSKTIIPPINGLNDHNMWTSKEALENTEKISDLLIVGAGVIGMEFASFFSSIGVKVFVVEMQNKILGNMDSEISQELQKALTKKGVKFYLSSKLESISNSNIANVLDSDGNKLEIKFDKILLSIGRKANVNGLCIENIGLETDKKGSISVDNYMKTSIDNVYAIGDVNGVSMLAHTASREAIIAVDNILGRKTEMKYDAIPGIIYSDPEVACVGKTEDELLSNDISFNIYKVPMALSGRFVIENEMVNGLCKIITSKDDIILGVHIIGNTSSEILTPAIIAVERKMTINDLKSIVFPHPTISEIIKTALFAH